MAQARSLIWIFAFLLMVVLFCFMLVRHLAEAEGGSYVTAEGKLTDCTNSSITVRIKKWPKRAWGVMLAVPPNGQTNQVAGLSGYYVITSKPPVTNSFAVSPTNRGRDLFPVEVDPITGHEFIDTDKALASFHLDSGDLRSFQSLRSGRSYTFSFYFSHLPATNASVWLKWTQPPGPRFRLE